MTEQQNLWELKNATDLKNMLKNNQTVIVGLVLPMTNTKDKITIRKFLKDKARKFPCIMFVFMEVQKMGELNLLSNNPELYPILYHIRDSQDILIKVEKATFASLYESFAVVEKYYLAEMAEILNKHQEEENTTDLLAEKGEFLKAKYEEYQTILIKDIQKRKLAETE